MGIYKKLTLKIPFHTLVKQPTSFSRLSSQLQDQSKTEEQESTQYPDIYGPEEARDLTYRKNHKEGEPLTVAELRPMLKADETKRTTHMQIWHIRNQARLLPQTWPWF